MRIVAFYLLPLLLLAFITTTLCTNSDRLAAAAADPNAAKVQALIDEGTSYLTKAREKNDPSAFLAAANVFEAAAKLDPDNLVVRQNLGDIYLNYLNDPKKAVPNLERVVDKMPGNLYYRKRLARAYFDSGDVDRAILQYREVAKLDPADVDSRLIAGRLLAQQKKNDEARQTFQEVLKIDPNNALAMTELKNLGEGKMSVAPATAGAPTPVIPALPPRKDDELTLSPRPAPIAGKGAAAPPSFPESPEGYINSPFHLSSHNESRVPMSRYQFRAVPNDPTTLIYSIDDPQNPRVSLSYYNFKDNNDLYQQGVFAAGRLALNDRATLYLHADERFFCDNPDDADRFTGGVDLEYRFNRRLSAVVGASTFITEDHGARVGFNAAIAFEPWHEASLYAFYRNMDPVDDSFATIQSAMHQSAVGVGFDIGLPGNTLLQLSAVDSFYSDGNNRRDFRGSLSHMLSFNHRLDEYRIVARLEYELINFINREPNYPSPTDLQIIRPVLDASPQIFPGFWIDIHGELPYLIHGGRFGTGFTVGPRMSLMRNRLEMTAVYMNYHIPNEDASNLTGQGFKVQLSYRF